MRNKFTLICTVTFILTACSTTQAQQVVEDLDIGNGDKYNGEVKFGKPDGKGRATGLDGISYEGEWLNGKPHGWGVETRPFGETYSGQWNNGVRQGEAAITWPDGFKFEGFFENGNPKGIGTCTFNSNTQDCRYELGKWIYPNQTDLPMDKSKAELKEITGEETWKGLWDKYLSKKSYNPMTKYQQTERLIRITDDDENAFIFFTKEMHSAHPSFAKIYMRSVEGRPKVSVFGTTWGDREKYDHFMKSEVIPFAQTLAKRIRQSLAQ